MSMYWGKSLFGPESQVGAQVSFGFLVADAGSKHGNAEFKKVRSSEWTAPTSVCCKMDLPELKGGGW